MTSIGDRLRRAADEADAMKNATAFAVIVTENSSFRFFLSHIEDEDEARTVCARGLVNAMGLDNRQEQHDAAELWTKGALGAPS